MLNAYGSAIGVAPFILFSSMAHCSSLTAPGRPLESEFLPATAFLPDKAHATAATLSLIHI